MSEDVISVDSLKELFPVNTADEQLNMANANKIIGLREIKPQLYSLLISKLPEKKKASINNPANGSNNHSFRLGANKAIDDMRKSIDELFGVQNG